MPPRPARPSGESCSLPSRALSQPTTTGGSVKTTEGVEIKISGSGSDDAHFAYYADIPAVYHQVETDNKIYLTVGAGGGAYTTYHTGFETFYLVDKILDPGFALSRSSAQLNLHIILQLAETALLPFSPANIVTVLEEEEEEDLHLT